MGAIMGRTFWDAVLPKSTREKVVGVLTIVGSICSIIGLALASGIAPTLQFVLFSLLLIALTAASWTAYAMHRSWRNERGKHEHDPEEAWWEECRRSIALHIVVAYNRLLLATDTATAFKGLFVVTELAWKAYLTPTEREQGNRIPDAWGHIATCYHKGNFAPTPELERAVRHIAFIWPPAGEAILPLNAKSSAADAASPEELASAVPDPRAVPWAQAEALLDRYEELSVNFDNPSEWDLGSWRADAVWNEKFDRFAAALDRLERAVESTPMPWYEHYRAACIAIRDVLSAPAPEPRGRSHYLNLSGSGVMARLQELTREARAAAERPTPPAGGSSRREADL